MSLKTDIVFVRALQSDAVLMNELAAKDVYNTSIALPDVDLDNAPLPYVIVSFDGLTNDVTTKDSSYEGDIDRVQIGIEVAATTRPRLAEIVESVRVTVREFVEGYTPPVGDDEDLSDLIPIDYTFSADPVGYDADKPCYFQTLRYNCDTKV